MIRQWQDAVPGDGPPILTSVTADEAARLGVLAAGRDVLEVGSARGYSAVVMALAGGRVTAVDDHCGLTWLGDTYAAMASNLAAYEVSDRVEIRYGRSEKLLPQLLDSGRRFGLVFIDGGHDYQSVRTDVTWAVQLLEPGGMLACHDYGEDNCPGVKQALDEIFPGGPARLTGTLFEVTL